MAVRQINSGRPGGQAKAKKVADFKFLDAAPKPPKYFSKAQGVEWKRACELLISRNDLTEGDLAMVENYSVAIVDYRELTEQVNQDGRTYINTNGNHMPHPAIKIRRDTELQISALSSMLGFSPKHRNAQAKENGVVQADNQSALNSGTNF